MKIKKTVFVLLLAFVSTITFTACNNVGEGDSGGTSQTSVETSQTGATSRTSESSRTGGDSALTADDSSTGSSGVSTGNHGSSSDSSDDAPLFTVMLNADDEKFEVISDNPASVRSGEDAAFSLKMKNNYCVDRVTRKGDDLKASIYNGYDNVATVVIPNTRYSMMVNVECVVATAYVSYHLNGGIYIEDQDPSKPYVVGHELKHRLRPNTEIGTDRIVRDGYIQIGWNTEADGGGEHIGLGSRVTLSKGQTLDLFAEWIKWSPISDFDYREENGGMTITRYKGKDRKIAVPEVIDGLFVDWIDFGAFGGNIDSVVLPKSVKGLSNGAFYNSSVKELYFYDNLETVSDRSFIGCGEFSTVHINAVLKPRYCKNNMFSEMSFADKYDILILNKDKRKLLVFGGSGAFISVDTVVIGEEIKRQTGEDYVCINMAVNGWFNGAAQFDMMAAYIREGDAFLHVPESSSAYNFMYDLSMTPEAVNFTYNKFRMYYCTESNYDLLSLVDIRGVTDFFNGFAGFNAERAELEESSYTDYVSQINIYGTVIENDLNYIDLNGNFALKRTPRGELLDFGEADIVPEYITDENAKAALKSRYKLISELGAKVFFLPAPINEDTLEIRLYHPEKLPPNATFLYFGRPEGIDIGYDDIASWVEAFDLAADENLNNEYCTVILHLSDMLFKTEDFFDSDFHLCDAKVPVYSAMIADALIGNLLDI